MSVTDDKIEDDFDISPGNDLYVQVLKQTLKHPDSASPSPRPPSPKQKKPPTTLVTHNPNTFFLKTVPIDFMLNRIFSMPEIGEQPRTYFEPYNSLSKSSSFSWRHLTRDVCSSIFPIFFLPIVLAAAVISVPIAFIVIIIKSLNDFFTNLFNGEIKEAAKNFLTLIFGPPLLIVAAAIALPLICFIATMVEVGLILAQTGNIINLIGSLLNSALHCILSINLTPNPVSNIPSN